jgi:nucleoside-diphosphate-sugar epimerase
MNISIVGVTGGVGSRVAQRLRARGHSVTGIVRRPDQAQELARQGATAKIADVAVDPVETMAESIKGSDIILFTAGAGGQDGHEATTAVDGNGPSKVAAAAKVAGVSRFYLVSVFPEAWREKRMDDDFEHYMVEKKKAESQLVLTDLGLAKIHREIRRDDVAETLITLMENPGITRVILEATGGFTPIDEAVAALIT